MDDIHEREKERRVDGGAGGDEDGGGGIEKCEREKYICEKQTW
jgi:hypothetical protein